MKFVSFLFGFLLLPLFAFAGTKFPVLDSLFKLELHNYGHHYNRPIEPCELIYVGNDTLINPVGSLYLYKLRNHELKRLDKSSFHGVFFNRYLFQYHGSVYQFGGEGLFLRHSNLLLFDSINIDWRLIDFNHNLDGYLAKLAFLNEDTLVFISENRSKEQLLGFYNFREKNSKLQEINLPSDQIHMLLGGKYLETVDEIIWIANQARVMCLNKKSLELKRLDNVPLSNYSLTLQSKLSKDFARFYFANGDSLVVKIADFKKVASLRQESSSWVTLILTIFVSIAAVFIIGLITLIGLEEKNQFF